MDKRTLLFVAALTLTFFVVNFFLGPNHDRKTEEEAPPAQELVTETPAQITDRENEKFFVLQTPYQQLVFSNIGGALAEINLNFESESHPASVVREIGIDRKMLEQDPTNAHFPDFVYYTPGKNSDAPPELHDGRELGGAYPLLRRALFERDGNVHRVAPEFYALNTTSKYPEVAQMEYAVTHFDDQSIVFEATSGQRIVRKTYTVSQDVPYVFDLRLDVEGNGEGLWLTSGVPDVELMSGRPMSYLKTRMQRNGGADTEKLKLPKEGQRVQVGSVHPDWIANSNGFFTLIMDPLEDIGAGYRAEYVPGNEVPSRLAALDTAHNRFPASRYPGYQMSMPLAKGSSTTALRVYAGPISGPVLRAADRAFVNPTTGHGPDYQSVQSFRGYFAWIAKPFSKFLLVIMQFFYSLTHSWGIAIILLTVVLRLLLYPLSGWSFKSMRRMQQLAPEVSAIQARNKKDPRKGQIEVMALYRERKVNPLSGCLPLLIQMPFLIAMFDLLRSTFALRGASFIPGWIDNLTAPDVLFSWNTPIFFIGNAFHLLPVLLGGVMFLQQRLSSSLPKDKSQWTDQQKQQRMMGRVMVVVFTVMFYRFASGLNLYFISSMALGILQQWITNRQLDRKQNSEPRRNGRRANA